MDVRGSVVLRDCIAQLCYANGALRSRDTIRTKTGSWDAPDPVRRKSAAADAVYCAVIRFHQFSLHVRDYREYREFHHERKDGGAGTSIMVINPALFRGKYIFRAARTKGEQKYASRRYEGVSCLRRRAPVMREF